MILEYIYVRLLNKLYDSNYFGIGLFAVISFLVVTFLIVLFFGKRDEKKRQLENSKEFAPSKPTDLNAFKETTPITPINLNNEIKEDVIPDVVAPIEPVAPISMDMPSNSVPVMEEPVIEPITPPVVEPQIIGEPVNIEPVITPQVPPVVPTIEESVVPVANTPVIEPIRPVVNNDFNNNPVSSTAFANITPVIPVNVEPTLVVSNKPETVEPIRYENIAPVIEPKVMEPVKFDMNTINNINNTSAFNNTEINKPIETPIVEPIIKEEQKSIVTPIIEEPVISGSYYRPVETPKAEEVKVPNFDFDAIAKSISKELDELENNVTNTYQEAPVVTPLKDITPTVEPKVTPVTTPQFSSVYVNEPVKPVVKTGIDLPNKIDLPTIKTDEIEPENYNI